MRSRSIGVNDDRIGGYFGTKKCNSVFFYIYNVLVVVLSLVSLFGLK